MSDVFIIFDKTKFLIFFSVFSPLV